jgi:hypothetical protein
MTPHWPTWEIITSKCPRSLLVSKKVDEGKEVIWFIVIVYILIFILLSLTCRSAFHMACPGNIDGSVLTHTFLLALQFTYFKSFDLELSRSRAEQPVLPRILRDTYPFPSPIPFSPLRPLQSKLRSANGDSGYRYCRTLREDKA